MDAPNCYDSEYTNEIIQDKNDELLTSQILSSSNCEYILIRIPPSIISFYSILDESIIYKWTLTNTNSSIWSLYSSHYTQTITITDDGYLNWSNDNNTLIHSIYSNSDEYLSSENQTNSEHSNSKKLSVSNGVNSNQSTNNFSSNVLNTEIIWIPILVCIIGTLFAILCCFLNKKFFDKKEKKTKIYLTEEEVTGTNNTNIYSDFGNEIDSFDYIVDDLHVNLDNIESDLDTDGTDGFDSDNEEDNNYLFDLGDHKLVSQDITVTNYILTPSNDYRFGYQNQIPNNQNIMI